MGQIDGLEERILDLSESGSDQKLIEDNEKKVSTDN